jgi:hypothetical protein
MRKSARILAIVTILGGSLARAGMVGVDKLSCRWESQAFSVSPTAEGYAVTLVNEEFASQFSIEALRKKFPTIDQKILEQMAAEFERSKMGEGSLGDCAQMQTCEFFTIGFPTLVTCTKKSDTSTNTLAVDLDDGFYRVKCTTDGSVDSHALGLKFSGTKKATSTFQVSIPPSSCVYEGHKN